MQRLQVKKCLYFVTVSSDHTVYIFFSTCSPSVPMEKYLLLKYMKVFVFMYCSSSVLFRSLSRWYSTTPVLKPYNRNIFYIFSIFVKSEIRVIMYSIPILNIQLLKVQNSLISTSNHCYTNVVSVWYRPIGENKTARQNDNCTDLFQQ